MNNLLGHLNTVLLHKYYVFIHAARLGLYKQGFMHDMSKFSPSEFLRGIKYYADGKHSPNDKERSIYGYSFAWLHHKGRNKHHFEYWTDYDPADRKIKPVKMPYKYLLEMLCDRLAASKVYQGKNYSDAHPLEYFMKGKQNRFIHPVTSDTLEELLSMIAKNGEINTFEYIRKNKVNLEKIYNEKQS